MRADFAKYDQLLEWEKHFSQLVEEQDLRLLGDVPINKGQLDEIAELIHYILHRKDTEAIKKKFPLTVSVFLVWCAVRFYQEGTFWKPIFEKLKIKQSFQMQDLLGETFLATLRKFDLQPLNLTDKSKKFMSAILMHGYISEHYASKLLDFLNRVYSSYLKYDVSSAAMEPMWKDIFNLEAGTVMDRTATIELEEEVRKIREELAEYRVPMPLRTLTRESLQEIEQKVNRLKNEKELADASLREIAQEQEILEEIRAGSQQLSHFLEKVDVTQHNALFMSDLKEVHELSGELEQEIENRIAQKEEKASDFKKQSKNLENLIVLEYGKEKDLKSSILTLGKGREDEGWGVLESYQQLTNQLNERSDALERKKTLNEIETHLQSASIKMTLTASLCHLATENPTLFREFIKNTLRSMDRGFRGEEIDDSYRMKDSILRWMKETRQQPAAPSATGRTDARKTTHHHRHRLQRPKLDAPELMYDTLKKELILQFPEQKITTPKGINQPPVLKLLGSGEPQEVTLLSEVRGQKLRTAEKNVKVETEELHSVLFEWFNLSEKWPMELEPLLIFDENGSLQQKKILSNGLYYFMLHEEWKPNTPDIIHQYRAGPQRYRVYEIFMKENNIAFFHETNSYALPIQVQSTEMKAVGITGIEKFNGITMEGLEVFKGSEPVLKIPMVEVEGKPHVFTLHYNGEELHRKTIENMKSVKGCQDEGNTLAIRLFQLLAERYQPYVMIFTVSLSDEQGQKVFEKTFSVIKGTSFIFEKDTLLVKVPMRSNLKHTAASKEGAFFHIPLEDERQIDLEIYYDRIGWKRFSIENPMVSCHIADQEIVPQRPIRFLKSNKNWLKGETITWSTESRIPKGINLFSHDKSLYTTIHLRKGSGSAGLNGFYDLMDDETEVVKVYYQWFGHGRASSPKLLMEAYHQWKVTEVSLFQTEEETENLFEIRFSSNFDALPNANVRVFEKDTPDHVLIDKEIESHSFYLYLKKERLSSDWLTFQIYYMETIESVFGDEEKEILCWTRDEKRIRRKEHIQYVLEKGLVLEAFTYEEASYCLKNTQIIRNITLSPRHFEGEELFKGFLTGPEETMEVLFYLEEESNKIPFLIDDDHDGVQYHPETGELFFDLRSDRHILAPLDDLTYRIHEEETSHEP